MNMEEKIMVCHISENHNGDPLLKRGVELSKMFDSPLYVLYLSAQSEESNQKEAFDRLELQAAFTPLLLMAMAAMEVLKLEAMSGWNKYVLTLPVKRNQVVQSHYLFFAMLAAVGLSIALISYFIVQFVFGIVPSSFYLTGVLDIMGIVFTMGFVAYPLTYILGTEKADVVAMAGTGAGIGLYFLSAIVYTFLPFNNVQNVSSDLHFSLSFMTINLILFVISYIVSVQVYKRKEF